MAKNLSKCEIADQIGDEFMNFLIAAVEAAAERARSIFRDGEEYDRAVGSTIVRYDVRKALKDSIGTTFDPHSNGFAVVNARNLAVWFDFEGYRVRCYTVGKNKLPIRGNASSKHRDAHFSNEMPEQPTLLSKPWIANVSLLWSFDRNGNVVALRAVVGDGWDETGQLKILEEYTLPTNAAEYLAERGLSNFTVSAELEPHGLTSDVAPGQEEVLISPRKG